MPERTPPPEDPLFDEPISGDSAEDKARGFVPELVRKVAVAGLGALFMTEEGIRSLAGQLKLPKEALSFIINQAEKTKDEIGRVVSEELRRFFQSEKLREEFLKLLAGMTIEVKAEVRLLPSQKQADAVVPHVNVTDLNARRGKKKRDG